MLHEAPAVTLVNHVLQERQTNVAWAAYATTYVNAMMRRRTASGPRGPMMRPLWKRVTTNMIATIQMTTHSQITRLTMLDVDDEPLVNQSRGVWRRSSAVALHCLIPLATRVPIEESSTISPQYRSLTASAGS